MSTEPSYEYDVAVSYASEQRWYVEEFVRHLKKKRVKVFFDKHEEIQLLGVYLHEELLKIYSEGSRYIIIFLSKDYLKKAYTMWEARTALGESVRRNNCVIVIKFDDSTLPGLHETLNHLETKAFPFPSEFADFFYQKLKDKPYVRKPINPETQLRKSFKQINDKISSMLHSLCECFGYAFDEDSSYNRNAYSVLEDDTTILFYQLMLSSSFSIQGSLLLWVLPSKPLNKENTYTAIITVLLDSKTNQIKYTIEDRGLLSMVKSESSFESIEDLIGIIEKVIRHVAR